MTEIWNGGETEGSKPCQGRAGCVNMVQHLISRLDESLVEGLIMGVS